jgi:hypothetical protein
MDRYGGSFGAHDDADLHGYEPAESFADPYEDHAPHAPPSPVGQDERRMQVRAYNHWAALLGDASYPDIADLHPESLDDFGPYGILLDFRGRKGLDDPRIAFIGSEIAAECGDETAFDRLSDVPGRSLLSRITDHYMQILANQAPIGFEAEFTNRRGADVLYRGILLPWSSDGETIDFVFGVINWKELADAETAERLLSAIDAALETPIPPYEEKDMDRMLDLSGFAVDSDHDEEIEPVTLPMPSFGTSATSAPLELSEEVDEEDYDEDAGEPSEWGAGFSGFGDDDTVYTVDYGDQGLEEGEEDEDFGGVVDPLGDQTASLGLASLVSRGGKAKQSVSLPGMEGYVEPSANAGTESATPEVAPAAPRTTLEQRLRAVIPQAYEPDHESAPLTRAPVYAPQGEPAPGQSGSAAPAPFEAPAAQGEDEVFDLADDMIEPVAEEAEAKVENAGADEAFPNEEVEGLYDCLAAARELAQTARSNEDRGRKALYQAVARAYDFSLEAVANPADFDELLAENGLTVQDRAPMTPIVKLVFGADYDKTRLTEYATVLAYAHRAGVARGTLDKVLGQAEGGLKGIVQAERQARKEAEGKPVEARTEVRQSLAKKLRKLEPVSLDDLAGEGSEFALVMVRRLPSGELVVLGEVPEDLSLVEKAAKKILG